MGYRRVMYGSDYPDRSIAVSMERSLQTFSDGGISVDNVKALVWKNAVECFGWTDL
jgi:predicted TIM-barrel fold metal-dependent hydrolase